MTEYAVGIDRIGRKLKQLLSGKSINVPLVWLWGAVPSFAVQNLGFPVVSAYNDPVKAFDAQLKTIAMFGEDGIPRMAVGGASDITWAFGGDIKWPTGEFDMAPVPLNHPVSSEADTDALEMPADVHMAGPLPMYLEFAGLQHAHGLPVFPFITSPIEGARSLCGPELLMRWMVKKPGLAHRLLRTATDYSSAVIKLFRHRFPDDVLMIYVAAPTASNQMISPTLFERFVLPYQHELHTKALDIGVSHIFCHVCGDHNKNLPMWQEIPMGDPGIVSFGHEIDIKKAIRFFGDHCVIAGNIEPAVIHLGTPKAVFHGCMEAIEKGTKAPRGYILMPGCGIPPNVPSYNLLMLKKAVETYAE